MCHVERKRNTSRKGGFPRSICYYNIKSVGFAFPGVCSPVEAGEVARIAGRRGATCRGDFGKPQDDKIVFARERSDRDNYIFYIVLFISALTE